MRQHSNPDATDTDRRPGGGTSRSRRLSPALLSGIVACVFVLPTAVVVFDIYRDRTTVEVGDFTPDGLDGLWRVRCGQLRGVLVHVRSIHPLSAVGRIQALGRGARHGYQRGDEIFRLSLGVDGHWRGKFHWRERRRPPRWRPMAIRKERRRTFGLSRQVRCFEHLVRPG